MVTHLLDLFHCIYHSVAVTTSQLTGHEYFALPQSVGAESLHPLNPMKQRIPGDMPMQCATQHSIELQS